MLKLSFPFNGVNRGFLAFSTLGLNMTSKATLVPVQLPACLQNNINELRVWNRT